MVCGTLKICKIACQRANKHAPQKHIEKQEKNNIERTTRTSRSAVYTERIWCFQFLSMLDFMKKYHEIVILFEVPDGFWEAQKDVKIMTFCDGTKSRFVL